jgi:hypothetical protein
MYKAVWAQSDLSATAEDMCTQALTQAWLQQGDNWFEGRTNQNSSTVTIVEYNGLKESLNSFPLSVADKMNGLAFNGYVNFSAVAYRVYSNGTWGGWQDPNGIVFQCGPIKDTNGQWRNDLSDGTLASVPGDPYKPNVSDLPDQ